MCSNISADKRDIIQISCVVHVHMLTCIAVSMHMDMLIGFSCIHALMYSCMWRLNCTCALCTCFYLYECRCIHPIRSLARNLEQTCKRLNFAQNAAACSTQHACNHRHETSHDQKMHSAAMQTYSCDVQASSMGKSMQACLQKPNCVLSCSSSVSDNKCRAISVNLASMFGRDAHAVHVRECKRLCLHQEGTLSLQASELHAVSGKMTQARCPLC